MKQWFYSKLMAPGRFKGAQLYEEHQRIWDCFYNNRAQKRDFLYRAAFDGNRLFYHLFSCRKPHAPGPGWSIQTRPYRPRFKTHHVLGFNLRVNPVTAMKEHLGERGKRRDLLTGLDPRSPDFMEDVTLRARNWLYDRAEKKGFNLNWDSLAISNLQKRRFTKNGRGRSLVITTLDFQGVLEVIRPLAFHESLHGGIGHSKGFGCGMLLCYSLTAKTNQTWAAIADATLA